MELTEEMLEAYVGGEMEIQNNTEGYLLRGVIAEIAIVGEDLKVLFVWLAKAKNFPPIPSGWAVDDDLNYATNLGLCAVINIGPSRPEIGGGNRLCLLNAIVSEICILFPADGSKLDPAKVEGLDLTEI